MAPSDRTLDAVSAAVAPDAVCGMIIGRTCILYFILFQELRNTKI